MSASAPLTLLGAGAPGCDGDACIVPDAASEPAVGSSPARPTER
ncbi:MAG: hypothetical protein JWQ92_2399 [Amnibacterium sp.]|nr:hypothetical protein [Amnibacterium sp.]